MGMKSFCSCPNPGGIPGGIPGAIPMQSQQLDFNESVPWFESGDLKNTWYFKIIYNLILLYIPLFILLVIFCCCWVSCRGGGEFEACLPKKAVGISPLILVQIQSPLQRVYTSEKIKFSHCPLLFNSLNTINSPIFFESSTHSFIPRFLLPAVIWRHRSTLWPVLEPWILLPSPDFLEPIRIWVKGNQGFLFPYSHGVLQHRLRWNHLQMDSVPQEHGRN